MSIAVQGTGGGLASAASSATPQEDTGPGTHTMIGGIVVQLVSMSVFSLLLFWTMFRTRGFWLSGPKLMQDAGKMRIILGATIFADCLILARNYYRAIELAQGWEGRLISYEAYFTVLDAALMVLAVLIFNIFHPAWYLRAEIKPDGVSHKAFEQPLSDSDEEMAVKKSQQFESSGRFQTRP